MKLNGNKGKPGKNRGEMVKVATGKKLEKIRKIRKNLKQFEKRGKKGKWKKEGKHFCQFSPWFT